MKIAIATDNDQVSGHFGGCTHFTIVEVEETGTTQKEVSRTLVEAPEHQPGAFPIFINKMGAKVIIAGGMGQRAQMAFKAMGIEPYTGISGSIDQTVREFLEGKLVSTESFCNHSHGEEGHHPHHDCHNH